MSRLSLETRRAIIKLAQSGKSKAFVMQKLGLKRCGVDRWFKDVFSKRLNVLDLNRFGRPRKFDVAVRKALKRSAIHN